MNGKGFLRSMTVFLLVIAFSVGTVGCSRDQEPSKNKGTAQNATSSLRNGQASVAQPGLPAPDFELLDIEGNIWKLSELKGQVVFVNFWATWCPPCREEMPSMQELYKAMPKDHFKMLTILSNDNPALAATFAEKNGFEFPILEDPGSEVGRAYGITGVPETYIIDKKGILRQKYIGPRHWNAPEAQQMLMVYINL